MERLHMNVLLEIVSRLRRGQSVRRVARDLGPCRNTVKKYRDASLAEGILDPGSPLPEPAQLGSPAVTWVPGPFRLLRTRCVLVQERASGSDGPQ
jgi:hypothetical protein